MRLKAEEEDEETKRHEEEKAAWLAKLDQQKAERIKLAKAKAAAEEE